MVKPERKPTGHGANRVLARLPLAPVLTLALMGLTLVLALIAAVAIGNLYSDRQDYEDTLARTYELESASSRILAAGVIEETALVAVGPGAPAARKRAQPAFARSTRTALALARGDRQSVRRVRARAAAQGRARRLAAAGRRPGSPAAAGDRLARGLNRARRLGDSITTRQRARRATARDKVRDDTRTALLVAAIAGGLALAGALALIAALISSIRRPLDSLVNATQRLAAGDLSERVEPDGPLELRELDSAFNTMADRLEGAQQRIEAEREKLQVTIESLGEALVVCDGEGRVTAVNPRAGEIVPELTVGTEAEGDHSTLPKLAEAMANEVVIDQESRTLSITAAALGSREGDGVVWTLRDITERARLDRIKSDFVATASHELRSPLTSIKGFVELLERSDSLGDREREFVGVILQSTDRLVDLVNDLLDVARLEAGRMEVHPRLFDLAELVREVAALMDPRVEAKDQQLELDLPPSLPRALADPVRVRQIVTNLISNAHQYTAEGGMITVVADQATPQLELTVSDTGRGMSAEDLESVFDRFVRRDDGGTGTGLGLSIVRSLVELQGGTIEVSSEVGEGTTFTVRLPAEPERDAQGTPRQAIRGMRVLVVDDEDDVAQVIAAHLGQYGVETEIATTGDAALERLRKNSFDALTLDILMEGESGLDVLRQMRADPELRRTPVVVVSIVSHHQAIFGEWKVAKPIDPDQLADAIGSAVLAGRTRVLVVGRSLVRPRLEPGLVRLGLDHEWVTSGAAAAQACESRRFEVALVDAGIRGPESVVRSLDLRGRRVGQAVLVFSEDGESSNGLAGSNVREVSIDDAAEAVLATLSQDLDSPAGVQGGPPG
ncbi:MAG: ATP-binding protein [Thermoleophilaceae bacterium]